MLEQVRRNGCLNSAVPLRMWMVWKVIQRTLPSVEKKRAGEQNPYQHSLSPSLDCSHIKSRGPLLAPLVDRISLMGKSTRSSAQLFIKQFRTGDDEKAQHQPDLKDRLRSILPARNFNRIFKNVISRHHLFPSCLLSKPSAFFQEHGKLTEYLPMSLLEMEKS